MGMMDEARAGRDLYATFDTTEGKIVVKLLTKDAPKTVENFVGLATGEKEWTHPGTRREADGHAALRRDHLPPLHPAAS